MDKERCISLVTQFLMAQGWELVNAHELAEEICPDIVAQGLIGKAAKDVVQQKIRPLYATILHDYCLRPHNEHYERAWAELRAWLLRQAPRESYQPEKHEDLVQETVLELQKKLRSAPLRTPSAFLVFALLILQNKAVDLARNEQAKSRGGDATTLSLDGMEAALETAHLLGATSPAADLREAEASAFDQLDEDQLIAFFQKYLPTDLQRYVAKAYFVDGLEPRMIAAIMGKPVHEIRLTKARVVARLRHLHAIGHPQLFDLLNVGESK